MIGAMNSLQNKIVLITGASSGIGEACARLFGRERAKLILTARRTEKLEKLKAELEQLTKVHTVTLDVRDAEAVDAAIKELPDEWKEIDVLVNNAGLSKGLEKIIDAKISDWQETINTNLSGLLYVSRAVMPGMYKRNRGHIINIGSISGREVYAGGSVYCATKFAVRGLTQAMRLESHGTPIRVTEIAPGAVETEFSVVRYEGDEERAKKTYEGMTPLSPLDVADSVVYAASRPEHVNISEIVLMSVDQTGVRHIHRRK
jgi:NADP-dependent 3-hydroxy acid dehydrogenase YdfG